MTIIQDFEEGGMKKREEEREGRRVVLEELKIFDKFFFLGGKMFYKTEYFVTCIPLGLRKVYILSCVYSIRTTLFKSIGDSDNGSIGASQPDRRSYVIFIKTKHFSLH